MALDQEFTAKTFVFLPAGTFASESSSRYWSYRKDERAKSGISGGGHRTVKYFHDRSSGADARMLV